MRFNKKIIKEYVNGKEIIKSISIPEEVYEIGVTILVNDIDIDIDKEDNLD